MTNIATSFDFFNNINLSIAKLSKFWSIELNKDLFFVLDHVVYGIINNDSPDEIVKRIEKDEEVSSLSEKIDITHIFNIAIKLTDDDLKDFYNPFSNICAGQLSSVHTCCNCRMQMYVYPNQQSVVCEHCNTVNNLRLNLDFKL